MNRTNEKEREDRSMKKRIISLVLALAMMTSFCGIVGANAEKVTNLQFYFAIVAGGAL